jgi:hypothetical protein
MKKADELWFEYTFTFKDEKIQFRIDLDPDTLNYIHPQPLETAEWAKLENEQCQNCPLKSEDQPYCPIALNLVNILPKFYDIFSYTEVDVTVDTPDRSFFSRTTLQRGLGSMLGIYMVTSGCPVMAKLKSMVRFHLPFATVEETVFRAASSYLLGQYFKHRKGLPADWTLDGLSHIYEEVQKVNMAMADRLRSIPAKDANINALIVLDVFAKEMPMNIEMSLKPLEYLFTE